MALRAWTRDEMSVIDSILRTVFSIADWRSSKMTERVRLRYTRHPPEIFSECGGRTTLFARGRVNLGDIAAWESDYCRLAAIGGVWVDKDRRARGLRLVDRICEISHLIAVNFASIWIRKLSIGDEHGDLPEVGVDSHAAISILWPAHLYAGCVPVVGDDLALRETHESANERIGATR